MKKITFVLMIITFLMFAGCKDDDQKSLYLPETKNDNISTAIAGNENKDKSEFCLISQNVIIELNTDMSKLQIQPTSVEQGSGDGFRWIINKYDDVEIKALISDDNKSIINKISTESTAYQTSRGIKVGDSVVTLKDMYKENLIYSESVEMKYYMYDPDNDIGFNRIYFYCTNDTITRIVIENGIDG